MAAVGEAARRFACCSEFAKTVPKDHQLSLWRVLTALVIEHAKVTEGDGTM